jgi:hypothetical protein
MSSESKFVGNVNREGQAFLSDLERTSSTALQESGLSNADDVRTWRQGTGKVQEQKSGSFSGKAHAQTSAELIDRAQG